MNTLSITNMDQLNELKEEDYEKVIFVRLSWCKLKEVPEILSKFNNMKELYLWHNDIEILPIFLSELPNLKWFSLKHNNIKEIPNWLQDMIDIGYAYFD